MNNEGKISLCANLVASLQFAVDECHVLQIVDSVLDEIADEIDALGKEDYSAEDVKEAVGRVLCRRLGLQGRK